VLQNTSGFVYYVSMTGVTGGSIANYDAVGEAVARIKRHTDLPVAVGFGVKTAADAAASPRARTASSSARRLVERVRLSLDARARPRKRRFRLSPRSSPSSQQASARPPRPPP
jgi:tryptophan synthase alpha chain